MDYTKSELMVVAAARELENDDSVLVGIGKPNLACNVAKRTHAPDLKMVYESGTIGSNPSSPPLSIGDPVLASGAVSIEPMRNGFNYYLQAGRLDVGFLGGAQIDKYGNINSTVIGGYDDPDVRLPGSGGACEIAGHVNRTLMITPHSERGFPNRSILSRAPVSSTVAKAGKNSDSTVDRRLLSPISPSADSTSAGRCTSTPFTRTPRGKRYVPRPAGKSSSPTT